MAANFAAATDTRTVFGSFNATCNAVPLPLCPLVGFPAGQGGVPAQCYSRNGEVLGNLVFMPSTLMIYIFALMATGTIIWNIRRKVTAVGRKEMICFFYIYMLTTLLEFLLVSGIVRASSAAYPVIAAMHVGAISATCWALLFNGLVGFQFVEDGKPKSLWGLRVSSFAVGLVAGLVALATFLGNMGLDRSHPVGLFVVYFVFNGACILAYIILQIVLVLNMLESRWPIGDILLGGFFFILSAAFLFFVGEPLCEYADHYIDGLFFGTTFNLLAVLMVYKYWDSITKEDLEFAVRGVGGSWEVRENLMLPNAAVGVENVYYDGGAKSGGAMYPSPLPQALDGGYAGAGAGEYYMYDPESPPLPQLPQHRGSAGGYPASPAVYRY